MKWIAKVCVFTTALVFGTFAASLFGYDTTPPITPVMEPVATTTRLTAQSLLGTWKGDCGLNNDECTIGIYSVEGNTFYGALEKDGLETLIEGRFNPRTRMFYFGTRIVRLNFQTLHWSLGSNSGIVSPDGHFLVGIGHDMNGRYSWTASNY
jgi:hypothetical protein